MSNKVDKGSCWYDNITTPTEMVKGATGVLWPILEESDHFSVLNRMLRTASESSTSILDLGCGAADVSRVCGTLFYLGVDMPHIIENVARQVNPFGRYDEFDAHDSDYGFVSSYDIVLMNAFIDVMEFPREILGKVLENSAKHVILHRQLISEGSPTSITKSQSYSGWTYRSAINREDFEKILCNHGFEILDEYVVRDYSGIDDTVEKSFLLTKKAEMGG
jgi:hypothetical protein